jgi:hypothetical protein
VPDPPGGHRVAPDSITPPAPWEAVPPAIAGERQGGEGRQEVPPYGAGAPERGEGADVPEEGDGTDRPGEGGGAGWQAAEAARDPSLGGITKAGLPKRRPRANLIPGSAGQIGQAGQGQAAQAAQAGQAGQAGQGDETTPGTRPPVSADQVRSRLSRFQQGIRRGRADLAEGGMERSDLDEG